MCSNARVASEQARRRARAPSHLRPRGLAAAQPGAPRPRGPVRVGELSRCKGRLMKALVYSCEEVTVQLQAATPQWKAGLMQQRWCRAGEQPHLHEGGHAGNHRDQCPVGEDHPLGDTWGGEAYTLSTKGLGEGTHGTRMLSVGTMSSHHTPSHASHTFIQAPHHTCIT